MRYIMVYIDRKMSERAVNKKLKIYLGLISKQIDNKNS